jgi:hypothetical protein
MLPLNTGVVYGLGSIFTSLIEGRISDTSYTECPDALGGWVLTELGVTECNAV